MIFICGIVGYITTKKGKELAAKKIMPTLLLNAESRGKDATGIGFIHSYKNKKVTFNLKSPLTAKEFIEMDEFKRYMSDDDIKPKIMIGHTRAKTQGNESNILNNHPQYDRGISVVHNGVISNDDELFKKHELKREGEVDSEIICKLISYFHHEEKLDLQESIEKTFLEVRGSAAIALISKDDPQTLYLAASTSPLWVAVDTKTENIYFGSTKSILENSLYEYDYPLNFFIKNKNKDDIIFEQVADDTGLKITKSSIEVFDLERPKSIVYNYQGNNFKEYRGFEKIKKPSRYTNDELQARIEVLERYKKNGTANEDEKRELKSVEACLAQRYLKEKNELAIVNQLCALTKKNNTEDDNAEYWDALAEREYYLSEGGAKVIEAELAN